MATLVRGAMVPVAAGLALGNGLAMGSSRVLAGFLYGVVATDPITYVLVAAGVSLAARAAGT